MTSSEFDIIRRFFTNQQSSRPDVSLGIGDDAALLLPPDGQQLVVSVDTLVAGVHFPVDTAPDSIGHKALAVNLSDLAAMGAAPSWFTLAITLPDSNDDWLRLFSQGLFALASEHNIQLIGGDTTRSPENSFLSITIQVMGFVPEGSALTRTGAVVGDSIYVTGNVGDAGAALLVTQDLLNPSTKIASNLRQMLDRPVPRTEVGESLRELATAAIDISDGLHADLNHLLTASNVGADIIIKNIPLSDDFRSLEIKDNWQFAVSAGDDYELCFTVPEKEESKLQSILNTSGCSFTKIGTVSNQTGIRWQDDEGNNVSLPIQGYDHFERQDVVND